MNILVFKQETVNPQKGGINRVCYVLNEAFKADGHNVYCLMIEKLEEGAKNDYYYLPDSKNFLSSANYNYVKRFIEEKKIDIILNHQGLGLDSSRLIMESKTSSTKLLSILHTGLTNAYGIKNHLPCWFVEYMPTLIINVLDRLANFLYYRKYKSYWDSLIYYNDNIVLLHKNLLYSAASFLHLPSSYPKFKWICNPCTLVNNEKGIPSKSKTLLFVGRLGKEKNLIALLKAWKKIYNIYEDWNLTIVGDGPCYHNLDNYIKKNHLKRVEMTGNQDPVNYYKKASILCITSLYEGLPLVLLEAMTFGCVPVVFNSFETASAIIDNEINGLLARPFSINDYANKLKTLMSDEGMLTRLSQCAYKTSLEYSVDVIKNQWYELFNAK